MQWASARAYNLTAGSDLNRDGNNNDRYIDPSTGQQVIINAGRGDPTFVFDLRTTKFIALGGEKRLGLFVEFFNLFNTVNFGSQYQGNGRSATFQQPNGYIPSIGYPRQAPTGGSVPLLGTEPNESRPQPTLRAACSLHLAEGHHITARSAALGRGALKVSRSLKPSIFQTAYSSTMQDSCHSPSGQGNEQSSRPQL